jgi:TonB family protein
MLRSRRSSSSAADDGYRIRLLSCLALSLGSLLVLLHLPLDASTPRVGWAPRGTPSLIDVHEVRESTEPEAARASDAPPPTRHVRPQPAPPVASTPPREEEASGTSTEAPPERPAPTSVAQLAPENQPRIEGGMGSLYLNIRYPRAARERGVEGRVIIRFTVRTDGRPTDIEVLKSLHPLCDSAAVRGLREVRFAPGRQGGTAVPVRMALPVRFKLAQVGAPASASSERAGSGT